MGPGRNVAGTLRVMALVQQSRDGVIVRVRAKPNARREGVLGVVNDQLVVAVRSPAERGKANETVLAVLAEWLDLPKSSFELRSGSSGRDKRILVKGKIEAEIRARIEERILA